MTLNSATSNTSKAKRRRHNRWKSLYSGNLAAQTTPFRAAKSMVIQYQWVQLPSVHFAHAPNSPLWIVLFLFGQENGRFNRPLQFAYFQFIYTTQTGHTRFQDLKKCLQMKASNPGLRPFSFPLSKLYLPPPSYSNSYPPLTLLNHNYLSWGPYSTFSDQFTQSDSVFHIPFLLH